MNSTNITIYKMSGRGKRNATGAPQPGRSHKRARMSNDDPCQEALDAVASLLERHPIQGARSTDEIVVDFQKAVPDGWTDVDEELVTTMWDESDLKGSTRNFSNPLHAALLKLWKISFRVFQRSPLGLTYLRVFMQYQPASKSQRSSHEIPSQTFCETLSRLMVYPLWRGSWRRLTCALQYVIVCRTKDYAAMEKVASSAEGCEALKLTNREMLKHKNDPEPPALHEIHRNAREKARGDGYECSTYSDFLFHLGETAAKHTSGRPSVLEEFTSFMEIPILPLTLWDLEIVVKAIDSMNGIVATEYTFKVEDGSKAWNKLKSGRELPTMSQLPDLYEAFAKESFREIVSLRKLQLQSQTADSGSEDYPPESPTHGQNEQEMDVDSERSSSPFSEEDNGDITMNNGDLLPPDEDQDESESSQEDDASESLGYEIEGPAMDNGEIPFVPEPDEGGGLINAETQLEGLGDTDDGTLSEPEFYNREISPTPQGLAMPTAPSHRPRVPVLSELSPGGDYRIIVRLERENRELRDALNKAREEVQRSEKRSREESQRYEERLQRFQRIHEREIECLERTINNQNNMIESLDESRRNSRNGLDATAIQSNPVLIYLGRQVRRQGDAIEEDRHNVTRVASRLESRMNLLEREVMTRQLESGRPIESTELDSNMVSPGSGRAPSVMRDSPMQGD